MLSRFRHKAGRALVILLVCATVVSMVACQFHPASSQHERGAPIRQHQAGHSDGISCLIAVLPEGLLLVTLAYVVYANGPVHLHSTPFALPLFIPPRSRTS